MAGLLRPLHEPTPNSELFYRRTSPTPYSPHRCRPSLLEGWHLDPRNEDTVCIQNEFAAMEPRIYGAALIPTEHQNTFFRVVFSFFSFSLSFYHPSRSPSKVGRVHTLVLSFVPLQHSYFSTARHASIQFHFALSRFSHHMYVFRGTALPGRYRTGLRLFLGTEGDRKK